MTERAHTALFLVAGLFVGYAYFYQGGGWNQNTRFALVRAIVDEHTLRIDRTAFWDGQIVTGDFARHDGHLHSDKAPGLALAAVPVVALAEPFVGAPASRRGITILSYVATLVTAALPRAATSCSAAWSACSAAGRRSPNTRPRSRRRSSPSSRSPTSGRRGSRAGVAWRSPWPRPRSGAPPS